MYKFYKLNPLEVGSSVDGFIPEGFIEYTEEPQELLEALALEKAKDELQAKVNEAQQYLTSTDHKFNTDYELKEGETEEDIANIKTKRSEARTFIRENKV